jgi:hypothetical protein
MAYVLYKRHLWAVIFVLSIAPVLGLISFDYQNWSNVADRYMYLPMFAIALSVSTFAIDRQIQRGIIMVTIILSIGSVVYASRWSDVYTLHSHAVKHYVKDMVQTKPDSLMILGIYHKRRGEKEKAQQYFDWAHRANYVRETLRKRFL